MCFVLPSWLAAECQTQGLCVYKDNIKENLSHYHNKRKPQIWPSLALTAVKLWCSYGEVLAATCLLFMCDLLANIFSNTSTHLFPSSVRSNFISPSGALAVNIMSPSVVVPEMSFCYWSDLRRYLWNGHNRETLQQPDIITFMKRGFIASLLY